MSKNQINRRDFLTGAVTLAAVAGCRSPKMTPSVKALGPQDSYDAEKIRFNADGEFRFLQLTDVHLQSCEGKLPEETDALLRQPSHFIKWV